MNSTSCARPACADKAAAWLAYDYEARCAWLDDEPVEAAGRVSRWPLCEHHADNLRVPKGWFCVDRRGPRFDAEADELTSSQGHSDATAGVAGPKRPGLTRPASGGRLTAIL